MSRPLIPASLSFPRRLRGGCWPLRVIRHHVTPGHLGWGWLMSPVPRGDPYCLGNVEWLVLRHRMTWTFLSCFLAQQAPLVFRGGSEKAERTPNLPSRGTEAPGSVGSVPALRPFRPPRQPLPSRGLSSSARLAGGLQQTPSEENFCRDLTNGFSRRPSRRRWACCLLFQPPDVLFWECRKCPCPLRETSLFSCVWGF